MTTELITSMGAREAANWVLKKLRSKNKGTAEKKAPAPAPKPNTFREEGKEAVENIKKPKKKRQNILEEMDKSGI